VPERAVASRLGIRVAIVGDPKDHSTRELLESFARRRMPEPRFLVVRLGSLGDIVHTFPPSQVSTNRFQTLKSFG